MRLTANPPQVDAERRAAARVPLDHQGPVARLLAAVSRRLYGDELDNVGAMLHQRQVLWSVFGFERRVARWGALREDLKTLAVLVSASAIGCSWCVDFGHYLARVQGSHLDAEALAEVARWRDSERFDATQRLVLAYAEAMTATPPEVTDDLAGRLRARIGDAALVELTMMVAVENQRSRFNAALGLRSQGMADRCELPE